MVGLGVDFRPGRPPRHSSPQAASEILLMIVAFLGSPSANVFTLSCMHARLLSWLLNPSDSLGQLIKKWGTWRGSDSSVALIGRRHNMRAMAALVAWTPLLEKY
jgi:hypothetical protein